MLEVLEINEKESKGNLSRLEKKRADLEEKIKRLKEEGKDTSEDRARLKEVSKISELLTPLTKYFLTEDANKIAYDALQIHGGAGYMKEFNVERLVRDARITNIYEGTSQLQIVAAIGGVINDVLVKYLDQKEHKQYKGNLSRLADTLKEMRVLFMDALKYVTDKDDKHFQDVAARDLVEMYGYIYVGYLLLDEAEKNPRKIWIANRYITHALAHCQHNITSIKNEEFSDLYHADEILLQ